MVGIDLHFMRYLYLALFDSRKASTVLTHSVMVDLAVLVFAIVPAFILGLRFVTAPVYINYRLKINGTVVPLLVPLCYLVTHWDILFLLLLVIWMNFYVFWYHVDPPENIYQTTNYKFKDNHVREEILKQQLVRHQYHS